MLYLIYSGKYLKVGFTNNLEKRMLNYNTCNPDFLILDVVEGSLKDESNFHQLIWEFNYRGEWFYYLKEIIDLWNKTYNRNVIEQDLDLTKSDLINMKLEENQYYENSSAKYFVYRVLNDLLLNLQYKYMPLLEYIDKKLESLNSDKDIQYIKDLELICDDLKELSYQILKKDNVIITLLSLEIEVLKSKLLINNY